MSSPTKNNRWKWVFAFIFAVAVGAAGFLAWFNLRLQLTAEKLEANRQRWQAKGPPNFVMRYTTRVNEEATNNYVVSVTGKKTTEVLVNGRALAEGLDYHGMDALYDNIERFLEMDSEKGKPRTYARAEFDQHTGAIREYVRSVMTKRERLRIDVRPLEVK